MQDELTAKMHAEFEIDEETEIFHRCIKLQYFWQADDTKPIFPELCKLACVTVEQEMKYKEECVKLNQKNTIISHINVFLHFLCFLLVLLK